MLQFSPVGFVWTLGKQTVTVIVLFLFSAVRPLPLRSVRTPCVTHELCSYPGAGGVRFEMLVVTFQSLRSPKLLFHSNATSESE